MSGDGRTSVAGAGGRTGAAPPAGAVRALLTRAYRAARRGVRGWGLRRFALLKAFDRFAMRRLRSGHAVVDGHRMLVDPTDALNLSVLGTYEAEEVETRLVKRLVGPGQVALDVGANIGYYTLILARLVGPQGRVVAFEPGPTNAEILRANVALNGYGNVEVWPVALSSRSGRERLFLSEENSGDHRLGSDAEERRASVDVEVVRLDERLDDLPPRVDFVKMDIQGAEAAALEGMEGLLRRDRDVRILSEFWPEALRGFGSDAVAHLEAMRGLGFRLYHVDRVREGLVEVTPDALLASGPVAQGRHTNVLYSRTPPPPELLAPEGA